jgi:UDP:flavonoid glycosyltransferase YjiC (YdhE family)
MPTDPRTNMSKFLFTLWEGGGEAPPILSIVRATAAAGHDVTVLADKVLGPDVEATGATWVPWTTAPSKSSYSPDEDLARDWEARTPLGGLPVRGLVTLGPAMAPDALGDDLPANVTVVASAPHAEVLEQASAVITHAGHGTIIKALAAGVPVVATPMGRDQPDNAIRAVEAGAAVALKPNAKADAIRDALQTILGEPRYAAAAGRLSAAIAAEAAGPDRALAELEALAAAARVAAAR